MIYKTCQMPECPNDARYVLYRLRADGSKKWMRVCEECEKAVGDTNMLLQGFKRNSRHDGKSGYWYKVKRR